MAAEHSHSVTTGMCRPAVAKSTRSSHRASIMNTTISTTNRSILISRHARMTATNAAAVAMAWGILRPVRLLIEAMASSASFSR